MVRLRPVRSDRRQMSKVEICRAWTKKDNAFDGKEGTARTNAEFTLEVIIFTVTERM